MTAPLLRAQAKAWRWAVALALCWTAGDAEAGWPLPADAGVAAHADPANWPSDPLFPEQWALFGFTPAALAGKLSLAERALGVGASVDRAWSMSLGDSRVRIAFLNAGVLWGEADLADRFALSRGELPPPQDASGSTSPGLDPWDLNGDGRFSVRDYTSAQAAEPLTVASVQDPRLSARADRGDLNGNGLIDPQDLIALFSDRRDDDGNGYVDDICGWDFAWNDNDPLDELGGGGAGPSAGTLDALDALAEAGNALGGAGVCPACMALPLRVGTRLLTDPTRIAAALRYATANQAKVAALPAQTPGSGTLLQAALDAAWHGGLTVIAAPDEGWGFRQGTPASLERTFLVRPLGFDGPSWRDSTTFWVDDRCSAFGAHTNASAPSPRCGPGAAALAAGIAGLLHSQALLSGLSPPLTSGEVHQLLQGEVDPVRPAWSATAGWGRLNARRALEAVSEGRIPPSLDIEQPRWFTPLTPGAPMGVVVKVSSRAPASLVLEAAAGLEPSEASFVPFLQVSVVGPVTLAANIDPTRLSFPPPRPEEDPHAFALTLRLRAVASYGDARGEVRAETRKEVFLHRPADLLEGYPHPLAGAGAASPRFVDLDNDGSDELVIATLDGQIHALGRRAEELPGFPLRVGPSALLASPTALDGGVPLQSIAATLAFEDLDEDGFLELVVSTTEGGLYAFRQDGGQLPGFPIELRDAGTLPCFVAGPTGCTASGFADAGLGGDRWRDVEPGLWASPVVAATPEGPLLLQAGLDGFIHGVWADGQRAKGFPLELKAGEGRSRVVATPAVADFDGDGWPEIVAVVTEPQGETWGYLFKGGSEGPGLREGWPVKLGTSGTTEPGRAALPSALIADLDAQGGLEIILQAAGNPLLVLNESGQQVLELDGSSGAGPATHPSAADLDGDGLLELIAGDSGPDRRARLLVWHAGQQLRSQTVFSAPAPLADGFPIALSGSAEGAGFAVADVSGDAFPEILSGSGYLLGAVNGPGDAALGWPKFVGGALASTPAVGLVSGSLAVAGATKEGWVFAFRGYGSTDRISWDGFHHDPRNTGFAGAPLFQRNEFSIGQPHPELRPPGCCSGAPGPAELWAITALLAWLSTRRGKTDS